MADTVAKHVFFSGRVQGVGFRQTCKRIAAGLDVGGYVRNLADGRVELWIEGSPEQIKVFWEQLMETMEALIAKADSEETAVQGYVGFQIKA